MPAQGFAFLALGAFLAGCVTPPAILAGRDIDLTAASKHYPPRTQPVEIAVAPDCRLRGLFVPARDGAPIVLHLQESSSSFASTSFNYQEIVQELRELGFASLIVDYAGVGASEGTRSPEHLERDTLAMWSEALRRVDGDSSRVIVRGISIGTLAGAFLLNHGAGPGAMILILPVRAETVAHRFAREFYGFAADWFVRAWYGRVAAIDIEHELAESKTPLLVIGSSADTFLSDSERHALRRAVSSSGGTWCERNEGHIAITVLAHRILPEELSLLHRLSPVAPLTGTALESALCRLPARVAVQFPRGSPQRERFAVLAANQDSLELAFPAALALCTKCSEEALRQRALWPRRMQRQRDFEALQCLLCLDDPAGELPREKFESMLLLWQLTHASQIAWPAPDPERIVAYVQSFDRNAPAPVWVDAVLQPTGTLTIKLTYDTLWEALSTRAPSIDDARRQFARMLLKASLIADRVQQTSAGDVRVEVKQRGAWRPLDLTSPRAQVATMPFITGAKSSNEHE